MAIGCRFLLSGLWFCFAVFRICHAHEFVQDDNLELLFGLRQLAVRSPSALCTWRVNSHLRPWASSSRRRHFVVPNCYWLILLAGDVETNPGPTKYPCTSCSKAVRNNRYVTRPFLVYLHIPFFNQYWSKWSTSGAKSG